MTEIFWNICFFYLANEEIQSGKIPYIFLIFPLHFLLNFLIHKIKEREFQKCLCRSLPYFYTYPAFYVMNIKCNDIDLGSDIFTIDLYMIWTLTKSFPKYNLCLSSNVGKNIITILHEIFQPLLYHWHDFKVSKNH